MRSATARTAILLIFAATLFALHLAVRWALWQRIIPVSALDVTTTFIFHWYAVAAAWGVWRDGIRWSGVLGVTAWLSLGLVLWVVAGLYDGAGMAFEQAEAVGMYNVVYWSIFFVFAAWWLSLARAFWGIRIVKVPSGPPDAAARGEPSPGRSSVWMPRISIGGLMALTAAIAIAAAFLRYAPSNIFAIFDGLIFPWAAAQLCIDAFAGSVKAATLLTFASLACYTAGRNIFLLAVAAAVACGAAVALEYASLQLNKDYVEYALDVAVNSPGSVWLNMSSPLMFDAPAELAPRIASALLTFISVLALPPLGYRISIGRENANVGYASSLS